MVSFATYGSMEEPSPSMGVNDWFEIKATVLAEFHSEYAHDVTAPPAVDARQSEGTERHSNFGWAACGQRGLKPLAHYSDKAVKAAEVVRPTHPQWA